MAKAHSQMFTRRQTLATGALGALGLRLGVSKVAAQTPVAGRRFIFLYVPGGWDQLLLLDPREHELVAPNVDAYKKEVARTGVDTGYINGPNRLAGSYVGSVASYFQPKIYRPLPNNPNFSFGPGTIAGKENGTPNSEVNLVQLAEKGLPIAMVRGINMGTLGHEPGFMYFLTGEPAVGNTARGTSMPIRLAAKMGDQNAVASDVVTPVVALGIDSFTGNKSGKYGAFKLASLNDTSRLLKRGAPLTESPAVEEALAAFARRKDSPAARASAEANILPQMRDANERVSALLASSIDQRFAFLSSEDPVSKAVRMQYGLSGSSLPTSAAAVAAFAAQSIKYGLSQFVSARFMGNFVDSHGGTNAGHMGGLYPCLAAVSALIDDLSKSPAAAPLKGSWLDNTTIVVFSEFARAPQFTYVGVGRDHHFSNSVLLAGAGVAPGGLVGRTSETGGMNPAYFDFEKRTTLPDGVRPSNASQRFILPEDIGATLLASAGLDYSEYRIGKPLWDVLTKKPS